MGQRVLHILRGTHALERSDELLTARDTEQAVPRASAGHKGGNARRRPDNCGAKRVLHHACEQNDHVADKRLANAWPAEHEHATRLEGDAKVRVDLLGVAVQRVQRDCDRKPLLRVRRTRVVRRQAQVGVVLTLRLCHLCLLFEPIVRLGKIGVPEGEDAGVWHAHERAR